MTIKQNLSGYAETLSPSEVRFDRLLPGPVERIWSYLVDSEKRGRWLATGAIQPQVGSSFELRFSNADLTSEPVPEKYQKHACAASGGHRLLRYEPPHAIAFTWSEAEAPSQVLFELTPEGDRVRLRITHSRLTPSEKIGVSGGWHAHLAMLSALLEDRELPPFWSLLGEVDAVYRSGESTPVDGGITLVLEREFAAPRERVWDAWTNPNSSVGWWGPAGFTRESEAMDLRVGGTYRLAMRSPDGEVHVNGGVYREIVPPERLVMTHGWENAAGELDAHTQLTITFAALEDGRTRMRFEQTGFTSTATRDGHREGWSEAFDSLAAALAKA